MTGFVQEQMRDESSDCTDCDLQASGSMPLARLERKLPTSMGAVAALTPGCKGGAAGVRSAS